MVQTKIQKWGNSYAVRIPKPIALRLGAHTGSRIDMTENDNVVLLKRAKTGVTMKDWQKYLIPTQHKRKRNISGRVDEIVYGVARPRR